MSGPRYFVHFAAPTPEDAHDVVGRHGAVVELRLYADPVATGVYGSAEIEPIQEPDE